MVRIFLNTRSANTDYRQELLKQSMRSLSIIGEPFSGCYIYIIVFGYSNKYCSFDKTKGEHHRRIGKPRATMRQSVVTACPG